MSKKIILEALFEIFLVVSLIFVFSISTSAVNADEENRVCCQKATVNGETKYCQYTTRNNCDPSGLVFDNKCEDVSICKPVCCNVNSLGYSASGGQGCFKSVSADVCRNELHGDPISDAQCNVPECNKGCCVVGSQATLTTEQGCNNLTATYPDLQVDFRSDITSEVECLNVARASKRGCCVTGTSGDTTNNCKMITFSECNSAGGEFYEDTPCSSLPSNNHACDQCKYNSNGAKLGCAPELDGGEDVYEYDKCGNPVKVAQNGNCDYAQGTLCREENGTARCKSLNCAAITLWDNPAVDENNDCSDSDLLNPNNPCWTDDNKTSTKFNNRNYRLNGESWCEYDADSGPTRDLPGSRHYVHTCYEGEDQVVECRDFREEYCVQFNGLDRTFAKCLPNKAVTNPCGECHDKECCENKLLRDCVWAPRDQERTVDDIRRIEESRCRHAQQGNSSYVCPPSQAEQQAQGSSDEGRCISLVPPGSRFWDGDQGSCAAANSDTTTYWSNVGWGADWDCNGGCVAYTQKFAYGQNTICRAQGDCGAGYNLAGQWSNYGFTRTCSVAGKIRDDYADGDVDTSDYLNRSYGDGNADELVESCEEKILDPGNRSDGELGFKQLVKYKNSLLVNLPPDASGAGFWALHGINAVLPGAIGVVVLGSIIGAALVAGTGTVSVLLGTTLAATGPLVGVPIIGWAIIIVVVVVLLVTYFTSDSSEEKVSVQCNAWQAPLSADNCHLCNEPGERKYLLDDGTYSTQHIDLTAGGKHQCTEYLCKSLGQGCMYTETDEGPKCISSCDISGPGGGPDVNSPVITTLSNLSAYDPLACRQGQDPGTNPAIDCSTTTTGSGYKIGPFVKENTDLIVGVQTNELAVCKWDWKIKSNFDDLGNYFDQSNAATVHTLTLQADRDLQPEDKKTIYVICRDVCGNPVGSFRSYTIDLEVAKMKDIGAPAFIGIEPADNSPVKSDLENNQTFAHLKLNEPATCRWSRTNDPYDVMSNLNEFNCRAAYLRGCGLKLTNISQGTNTFYIRCKDRSNNTNADALPSNNGYRLIRSDQLNITNVKCKHGFGEECGIIYDNNFTLELTTLGGGYNGRATCYYGGIPFFSTNSSINTQVIGPKPSGNYTENIRCADDIDNEAKVDVNYTFVVDTTPPRILRLTIEGGNLNVLTDEVATCKYADNSSIIFDEMTQFTSTGNTTLHTTSFGGRDYLHVKCVDRFSHVASADVYQAKKTS